MALYASTPSDENEAHIESIKAKLLAKFDKARKAKAKAQTAFEGAGMTNWQAAASNYNRWKVAIANHPGFVAGTEAARKVRAEGGTEEQAQAAATAAWKATQVAPVGSPTP